MHLRFKRKDTTVFFLCEPSDTFLKLKLRLAEVIRAPAASIRLYGDVDKGVQFSDEAIVSDFPSAVTDGGVVYFTLSDAETISITEVVPHSASAVATGAAGGAVAGKA